jgi:hypothetical protein
LKVGEARPYVDCSCRRPRSEINNTCDIGSAMIKAWEEDAAREIELLVRSRYPLIVVDTVEEDRLRDLLRRTASRLELNLFDWTRTRGLVRDGLDRGVYDTSDPLRLLAHLAASDAPGLYLLADFHSYLSDRLVARTFRESLQTFTGDRRGLVLSGHGIDLPPEIAVHSVPWTMVLPGPEAIHAELTRTVRELHDELGIEVRLTVDDARALTLNLSGLTLVEIRRAIRRAALDDRVLDRSDLQGLIDAKRDAIARGGVLEWFPASTEPEPIGGMQRLVDWLSKRRGTFDQSAREFGLEPPRGLLMIGVQGCGKSLVARNVARSWGLPLVRLDPGTLYDKYVGETEKNLRQALQTVDAMAPVVLWIDEIEKGLATGGADADGGVSRRLLGTFLTWFQERAPGVFVVATANEVSQLPPELLRKGRFDEIFFVDLPSLEERSQIFAMHLEKRKRNPGDFDLESLAAASDGFSGAEIEQAIVAGLYTAWSGEREIDSEVLLTEVETAVPLSRTMAERIRELREWARGRAVPAA